MISKRVFIAIKEERFPVVGDLIRSSATGNFINIVLEVTPPRNIKGQQAVLVRSVRYGDTNGDDFKLLHGMRSKWIKMYATLKWTGWSIVEEFAKHDNSEIVRNILEAMKGVDTTWRPPVESIDTQQTSS